MRRTVAATCLEKPYAQKLLIPNIGGQVLITGKGCAPQKGHEDIEHLRGKHLYYFVFGNGPEECKTNFAAGSHSCVSYCDEKKAKICNVIKMECVKLPKK